MDVCKCTLPSRHGGTLNSRRAASPLMRSEASDYSQGVAPQHWGETELNHSVSSAMLKATANDGILSPFP
ncbi:hypothetical protein TNCV_2342091 [Trichonephila clavipes]|nr:hypothetical protein TNCV_2342091 [Trichonephila clavipes]